MKQKIRKLLALILSFAMIISLAPVNVLANAENSNQNSGYVVMSLEGLSIAEGMYVMPTKISYDDILTVWKDAGVTLEKDNITAAQATYAFFKMMEIETEPADAESYNSSSFYLSNVKNIRKDGSSLGEFDEGETSGWCINVNNRLIDVSAGSYKIKTSDVIRWQYSKEYSEKTLPDRGTLYEAYADNAELIESDSALKAAVTAVISKNDAREEELLEAYNSIIAKKNGGKVSVELKMNKVSQTCKLYASDNTEVEIPEGAYDSSSYTYKLMLTPGQYKVTGYATDSETVNGSVWFEVSDELVQIISIYTVSGIKCGNSGWVKDTDYTLETRLIDNEMNARQYETGITTGNNPTVSLLCLAGDTIKAIVTPIGEKEEGFLPKTQSATITMNRTISAITAPEKRNVKITVPEGAAVNSGTLTDSYVYTDTPFVGEAVHNEADDTVTYSFVWAKGTNYYYRVCMDNAVTYWNWAKVADYSEGMDYVAYTVNKEDMCYASDDFKKDTLIHDLSANRYDVADIYMTAGEKGFINMKSGQETTIDCYRNWQAIEGISNAQVAEPDFHYTVIDENGNPSDILDINAPGNGSECNITAKQSGTAIVLVTYDAMINAVGMGKYTHFSAIWPENTGVFVVNVDKESDIDTTMTINETYDNSSKYAGNNIDAELDILYYEAGTNGASYTFGVEEGAQVSVMAPVIADNKCTYKGFAADNVKYNPDNTVTVNNLTNGSNIIRITNDNSEVYQVIRAKEVKITKKYFDENDEEISEDELKAGGSVEVSFGERTEDGTAYNGIYTPANKLAGIYNMSSSLCYTDENGNEYKGAANQYMFASNAPSQTVRFEIPENYDKDSITFKGTIMQSGFGSKYGMHRILTHKKGKTAQFNAVSCKAYMGVLPSIKVYVANDNQVNVNVIVEDYAAKNAGVEEASESGVILNTRVKALSAPGAVEKALTKNNVPYIESDNYISSINGLSSVPGYYMSGWMVSYNNDDYDNRGLGYINLEDNSTIKLSYSLDGGADIAAASAGLPTLKTLDIDGKKYQFETETTYDANWNASYTYKLDGKEITGFGSKENPFVVEYAVKPELSGNSIEYSYTTYALPEYVTAEVTGGAMIVNDKTVLSTTENTELIITSAGNRKAYYILKPVAAEPVATPTPKPTITPTASPTHTPTEEPTVAPSEAPTEQPTKTPTQEPAKTPAATSTPNHVGTVDNNTSSGDSVVKLKSIKISAVKCVKNSVKISGKVSVSGATVRIKVGGKAYKKARVKGKKFTLKVAKLKKKTKVVIKVTKNGYKGLSKVYKVK